jgi:Tfp pilus assembly protein PilO
VKHRAIQQRQLLVLALATVIVAGIGLSLCLPKYYELILVRKKVEHKKASQNAKIRTGRHGWDIAAQVTEARKQSDVLLDRIPDSDRLLKFLATIAEFARNEQLTNRVVEHGKPENFGFYKRQTITVSLDGKFEAIYRFLWQLEHGRRLCWIDRLILTGRDQDSETVHMEVHLSIFHLQSPGRRRHPASQRQLRGKDKAAGEGRA